jgi:hypothetical protein
MWKYTSSNELYHHGILGMKWGVRRYQNKDGSLTAAGRKRANKLATQYETVTGKKIYNHNNTSSNTKNSTSTKSVKDMSDAELNSKVNRMRLEQQYLSMMPKQTKSTGRKFIESIGKNVIAPAATQASKNVLQSYLEKLGREALDLNTGNNKKKTLTKSKNS